MLTVQSLLDELDLELAAASQAAEAPVRWVHISELEDPTPWLSGGELMLTTGIPLDTAAKQRSYIRLLAEHNLAGLGFGTGFSHEKLPKALVEEAKKRDFPLFEVPYSTPFIAITEKAFARLVNEQYEVLQRGIAVQRRLERLVLEERGRLSASMSLVMRLISTPGLFLVKKPIDIVCRWVKTRSRRSCRARVPTQPTRYVCRKEAPA